jgi:hypothetical protein
MSQPTRYHKSQDFAGAQSGNTLAPIPGAYFDTEFNLVQETLDQICDNLALLQRDDGALANGSVHPDALSASVVAMIGGWLPRGAWTALVYYSVKDMVTQANQLYVATMAHTSGTFSTDLAAGKWQLVSAPTAAGNVSNTPAGSIAATNVQAAINELDAEKQPLDPTLTGLAAVVTAPDKLLYATALDTFAATDFSNFARSLLDDVDAAAARATLGALSKAGDTLTGELVAAADPTTPLAMATKKYVDSSVIGLGTGDTRQTIMGGPVTGAGLPSLFPASSAGLNLTTQNVSVSAPLAATSAQGWSSSNARRVDRLGVAIANLTWTGLANGATNYLYLTINDDGTLSPGFTTTAPVYQWGGAASTSLGNFTFNIAEMKGYLGNGTAALASNIVFVGEAVTSGGNIASTVCYPYNGKYDSGFLGDLPATNTAASVNHNISVYPRMTDFVIECTSAEGGYSVGDRIALGSIHNYDGTNIRLPTLSTTAKAMSVIASDWLVVHKSTAVGTILTRNKWRYKMIAERGW